MGDKADPMARFAEKPPSTASIVWESDYQWNDAEWLAARAASSPSPRRWRSTRCTSPRGASTWQPRRAGIYNWHEIADALVPYLKDLGFTHVELMPVMQHPFGGSWGYHVTSYFAPDSRFGDPDGLS